VRTTGQPATERHQLSTGQSLELAEVTYTNVTLTDRTNDVSIAIGGTFASGCLLPNVRGACTSQQRTTASDPEALRE
jgi:hypothetical protein